MSPIRRGALVVVLLLAVGGLCVTYDVAEDAWSPYPSEAELDADYDRHVGETTLVFGTVERVDRDSKTARVRVEHEDGSFTLTLREFDAAVERGGIVQAYGTLEPDRTMRVSETVVVNRSGGSELYKYAVSLVGAALILLLFFRRWRVSFDPPGFETRGDAAFEVRDDA